jgi:DNA helicase-2/ATP-dependent DNA helicase PcrA
MMPSNPSTVSTLLARLNPQQRAVVTAPDGHALVLAGAGTGKTTTLVHRVSWLIEQGVDPSEILLLTFTRKAAEEMMRRAAQILDQPTIAIAGGTFHGWAHGLLRRYGRHISLSPTFTPLNEDDVLDLLGQIRAHYGRGRVQKLPTKHTLARLLSKSVNLGLSLAETIAREEEPVRVHLATVELIAKDYQALKRAQHLVDYDDLLVLLRELLTTVPTVREHLQATYRHVLVDEYQDTNGLQADILAALAGPKTGIMVVGDDCQSIYGFRGADVQQIRTFSDRFSATTYRLEGNYRSGPSILHVANHIASHSAVALPKTLVTTRQDIASPQLVACQTPSDQARVVTQQIQDWLTAGIPPEDIAVLFRASHHAHDIELQLNHAHIPFEKRGGLSIHDLAHVKDLVSYLRVTHNPADSIAWRRLLLMLPKIGAKSCDTIMTHCLHAADPIARLRTVSQQYPAVTGLCRTLDQLRTPHALLTELLQTAWTHYADLLPRLYDDPMRRQSDLQRLIHLAENYSDIQTFLSDLVLDGTSEQTTTQRDRIVLSTIHSAKGLEWRAVIVINVAEGIFPGWRNMDDQSGVDEDLRLLYVAVTRAKEHLVLTYPSLVHEHTTGLSSPCVPSRFVATIPHTILSRRLATLPITIGDNANQ